MRSTENEVKMLRSDALQHAQAVLVAAERAAQELGESERRFRDMLGNLELLSVMLDSEARITYCNDYLLKLTGWQQGEVLGRNWIDLFVPPELVEGMKGIYSALLNNLPATRHHENEILTRTGARRLVRWNNSLLRSPSGAAVGTACIGEDITERRQTEAKLARTEELYRRAIAGAGAVPYSLDYKSKSYVFIGGGIEKLIGYPPNQVNGQLWNEIIQESIMAGETAGISKEEATRLVTAGELKTWRCDMRVRTRDGKSRWIADASVQNLDGAGHAVGSMGILQDITERKQSEISALAFSKLGGRLSSAASAQAAFEIITEVSQELFGWDAFWIQLYSAKTDLIYSEVMVDTIDGKQVVEERGDPRKPSDLYRRIVTRGAELIRREKPTAPLPGALAFGNLAKLSAVIMFVPIHSRNKVVGALSVQSYRPLAFDQPDLKTLQTMADLCGGTFERIWADEARCQSESQFRLVWNASADGMRLADRDGLILMVNQVFCEMVGKSKAELEGQLVSIIQQPERAGHILRKHREQMDAHSVPSHLEKEITLWDGRKLWFELSNSLLDLPGHPSLMLSIFRDITSRKQAEAELARTHLELLETSRQAGMAEVATGVLHNVGNVLNSVNVASSYVATSIRKSKSSNLSKVVALFREHEADLGGFLTEDPKGRQIPGYLGQLAEHLAAEQASALTELAGLQKNIEHIKDIVTMQQGFAKISGATETLVATDLVEDALKMNSSGLARHDIAVTRDYQVVPLITVEKQKVLQILVNLVRNAKQACDEAGSREKRLTLVVTNGNHRVRIAVVDNGIGIPPENLARIFAHGFTTKKSGHGFGLHSGALAAREMGGSLSVESGGLELGSTFTLELPLTPGIHL